MEPHDASSQSLVIVIEEGLLGPEFNKLVIYLGACLGACGTVSSWTKDDDMVYKHHECLKGGLC